MLIDTRKITIGLAIVVFTVILPAGLIWSMLLGHFTAQRSRLVKEAFDQLAQRLLPLEKYHDDRVFLHALLQKNFAMIDQQAGSRQLLEKKLTALRRLFPGKLKFVVYDGRGGVDRRLSDELKYLYVLKTMYDVLHELKRLYQEDPANDPTGSALLTSKISLLRGAFGDFLVQNLMLEPLQAGNMGKCLFVSDDPARQFLWYYPGVDFSLVCSIDAALIHSNTGLKMIVDRVNAENGPVKLGFINLFSYQGYGLPADAGAETELKLEARKFESYAVVARESTGFLAHFRQVSPDNLILSYQSNKMLLQPSAAATAALVGFLRWLLVMGFVFYCFFLRYRCFSLSVQLKTMLLFFFANGLPLLIMVSVGYEFFTAKKKELFNAVHEESVRVLKEFDFRFPEAGKSLARRLNAYIDERNKIYGPERWPEREISGLSSVTAEIEPQEGALYDYDGKMLFRITTTFDPSERIARDLLTKGLEFFNAGVVKPGSSIRDSFLSEMSSDDRILNNFLWFLGRFVVLNTGYSGRQTYIKFLGGEKAQTGEFFAWAAYVISWDQLSFIRTFIPGKIAETAATFAPRRLIVLERSRGEIFSQLPIVNDEIGRLLKHTPGRKLVARENVDLEGKKYLFTAIVGNEIDNGVLAVLYPQETVEKEITGLKNVFFLAGLLIAFVLFQLVRFFASRLLVPVEELAQGINRMRARDFDYRLQYRSEDEFGALVNAFNTALEGMRELAVGTAVQESLLPSGNFSGGQSRLFARSLFMSKMGGDYFDYYSLPGNRLGIFFGDVAGHGIPAAMIMAMAKAVIASAASQACPIGPISLLDAVNNVLLELKKKNWRRMMTALCIDYDMQSGEFSFANAGHCYPALVGSRGSAVKLLEHNGMPLGSSGRRPRTIFSGRLQPGETLVLYTDGIVEAVGDSGEQFGYRRFCELLQSAWDQDLEVYWRNVIAAWNSWSDAQDDDLTFMFLRLEEKDGSH